ncbi:MAG TPA: mandelate racemase [Alcanivorax sp.]|nr:mandelate racemase [Alcanivorax sp.]
MRIIDIRECTVGLEGNVANALVNFRDHTVSLVALLSDQQRDGKPVVGFGFNSIGRFGQSGILRERLIPRLRVARDEELLTADGLSFDPGAFAKISMRNEKPGGHGDRAGAVAALELAAWDLKAKLADEPAYQTIRKYFNLSSNSNSADVYAAGGYYYPDDSLSRLQDELKTYQDMGYEAFKVKVGGAPLSDDMRRIESAIAVAGAGKRLAIDANGRFNMRQAEQMAKEIEALELRWYEEPGDPLDFELNKHITEIYHSAVATGENLFSVIDTKNLIQFGGMRAGKDIFQMDPGLSYGLTEYVGMLGIMEASGFKREQCYPHGGHLINLHVVIGLGLGGCEAYPGVFQPFGGYSSQNEVQEGRILPSDAPGFGLEQKENLYPHLQLLSETVDGKN